MLNKKFIKKYWIIPLLILRAFFQAITQLAWGLVSLGLLGWTTFFLRKEYPLVKIPDLTGVLSIGVDLILNNLSLFFWTFFIIYMYFDIKQIQEEKKQ
jgi:hypothetical protein